MFAPLGKAWHNLNNRWFFRKLSNAKNMSIPERQPANESLYREIVNINNRTQETYGNFNNQMNPCNAVEELKYFGHNVSQVFSYNIGTGKLNYNVLYLTNYI